MKSLMSWKRIISLGSEIKVSYQGFFIHVIPINFSYYINSNIWRIFKEIFIQKMVFIESNAAKCGKHCYIDTAFQESLQKKGSYNRISKITFRHDFWHWILCFNYFKNNISALKMLKILLHIKFLFIKYYNNLLDFSLLLFIQLLLFQLFPSFLLLKAIAKGKHVAFSFQRD